MLPLIKEPGRLPKHPFRDIVDAILYIDRSGAFLAAAPGGLPALAERLRLVPAVTVRAGGRAGAG